MRLERLACVLLLAACSTGVLAENPASTPDDSNQLKPLSRFDAIADRRERSIALFVESGKVLQSPRCLNCHPVERSPTQGDDMHPHSPPVEGGANNTGTAGMPCKACHGDTNATTLEGSIKSIPGDPHWSLAPQSMAWQGKSLGEICEQIKDPARNGGRNLEKIHEHMAVDHLVGWAWHPGEGRKPAPGTQEQFGKLLQAWIDTGAACPAP